MNPLLSIGVDKIVLDGVKKDIDIIDTDDNIIETSFKDFLSNLLLHSDTKNKKIPLNTKNNIKKQENNQKAEILPKEETKKTPPALEEILNLVVFLKSNGLNGNFPTDSKILNNVLANKQALKEFKEIKNLQELFKVAQKYDIKIEKFEFSKNEDKNIEIKINKVLKEFTLRQNHFLKKQTISSEKVLTNIKEKKNTAIKQTPKKEKSILSSILKTDTYAIKQNINNHKEKDTNISPKFSPDLSAKNINISPKSSPDISVKNIKQNEPKPIQNKKENSLLKTINNQVKKEVTKPTISIETKNLKNKKSNKPKYTEKMEIKESSILHKSKTFNKMVDNIKKDISHTNAKKHSLSTENITQIPKDDHNKKLNLSDNDNNIKSSTQHMTQNINIRNHNTNTQSKNFQIKHTINSFANDLKEQIENFKPPIMRVKMMLTPKDLGEVSVSLVNRGNNLQITINSNTNTMAIFTQNQAEFKNALVNMGFTNLNMNFSSNSNGKNAQQNSQKEKQKDNFESFADPIIEALDRVDIIIPRYV